jgi:hypothetical protein
MRETPAEDRRDDPNTVRPLNPADPFIVRHGAGEPSITVTTEQRQALREVRNAYGRLPRRDLRTDVLASLLRARMVTVYADFVELTVLGALAISTQI